MKAVIFDLAGTTVDHGCQAPVGVFVEVFRRAGVAVERAVAREPMGTHKREHIRRLCAHPTVAAGWRAVHGHEPTSDDVDALFEAAQPLQMDVLAQHAELIDGTLHVVAELRERGYRIGVTTGYTRAMLDVLLEELRPRGFVPDAAVAATEVPSGRPAPFLLWTAAMRLGAWPAADILAVGDTPVDVEAARAAGMWSVGVTLSGNEVGLGAGELAALTGPERARVREVARARLEPAGAWRIIDSVAHLLPVVDEVERRGLAGERP